MFMPTFAVFPEPVEDRNQVGHFHNPFICMQVCLAGEATGNVYQRIFIVRSRLAYVVLQFFLVLEGYDCFSAKTFSLKNELDLAEKAKETINNDENHLEKSSCFPTLYCQQLLKTVVKL